MKPGKIHNSFKTGGAPNEGGFDLYLSNDLDILADYFLKEIKNIKPANPLKEKTTVIVQTKGMSRFLSLRMADRAGICSNVEFPNPRGFISGVLESCGLIGPEDIRYFERSSMIIEIMKMLRNGGDKILSRCNPRYGDYINNGTNMGQFSVRLADIFDQYMTYRPEFINDNLLIKDGWQRDLFTNLLDAGGKMPVPLAKAIMRFQNDGYKHADTLRGFGTVYLFSVSVLPPVYIDFFKKLSEYLRICLFNINPSRHYWFDDLTDKEVLRLVKKGKATKGLPSSRNDLHFFRSNPVFINNAKLLQNFFYFLYSGEPVPNEIEDYNGYGNGEGNDTVLKAVKRGILENALSPDSAGSLSNGSPGCEDLSLQVHSYHSRFREMEGLYNYILNIIKHDDSITMEDILVMCPNIEEYSPYIDGIFSDKEIFYNISDDMKFKHDSGVRSLFHILDNLKDDLSSRDLISIFELEPLREKIGLDQSGYETALSWIKGLNIRRGLAEDYLPEPYNTIGYGAKRLLAGYLCMPSEAETPDTDAALFPYGGVSVSNAGVLGRFLFVVDKVSELTEKVKCEKSLREFNEILEEISGLFISDSFSASTVFKEFMKAAKKLANDDFTVSFPAYMELLKNIISDDVSGEGRNNYGFMRGGITFSELLPLRSIPFKVICLTGLNDADFPRKPITPFFNQLESRPRKGDRSSRLNDRLLFLESILAAGDYFYISYLGKNLKNNKRINPSIVVSELMDYASIDPVEHPLHPFHPSYFAGENRRIINFSREDFEVAGMIIGNPGMEEKAAEFSEPVKRDRGFYAPEPDGKEPVSLKEIDSLLKDPVMGYFNYNHIYLYSGKEEIKENEDIAFDALGEYKLRTKIFNGEITGMERLRKTGLLPHDNLGRFQWEKTAVEVANMEENFKDVLSIETGKKVSISDFKRYILKKFNIGCGILSGEIDSVYREGDKGILLSLDMGKSELNKKADAGGELKLLLHATLAGCEMIFLANAAGTIRKKFCTIKECGLNEDDFLKLAMNYYNSALTSPLPLIPELGEKAGESHDFLNEKERFIDIISDRVRKNGFKEDLYMKLLLEKIDDFADGDYLRKVNYYNRELFFYINNCFNGRNCK